LGGYGLTSGLRWALVWLGQFLLSKRDRRIIPGAKATGARGQLGCTGLVGGDQSVRKLGREIPRLVKVLGLKVGWGDSQAEVAVAVLATR
jgi:hypothetical protein